MENLKNAKTIDDYLEHKTIETHRLYGKPDGSKQYKGLDCASLSFETNLFYVTFFTGFDKATHAMDVLTKHYPDFIQSHDVHIRNNSGQRVNKAGNNSNDDFLDRYRNISVPENKTIKVKSTKLFEYKGLSLCVTRSDNIKTNNYAITEPITGYRITSFESKAQYEHTLITAGKKRLNQFVKRFISISDFTARVDKAISNALKEKGTNYAK